MDSKDVGAGISSPPQAFVEKEFLTNAKLLLKDPGKAKHVAIHVHVIRSLWEVIYTINLFFLL